jgi:hypothetical protein
VARPRLVTSSLDEIVAECPARLQGKVGEVAGCTLGGELARPEVLLIDKSPPNTR